MTKPQFLTIITKTNCYPFIIQQAILPAVLKGNITKYFMYIYHVYIYTYIISETLVAIA